MQDIEGVALAAIPGLHQQLAQKGREIAKLTAKVAEVEMLTGKLEAIEAKLGLKSGPPLRGGGPNSVGLFASPPWPSSVRAEQHAWLR